LADLEAGRERSVAQKLKLESALESADVESAARLEKKIVRAEKDIQSFLKRIDDHKRWKAEFEASEERRRANLEAEILRIAEDGGTFWFRRFHTSLAIANGAAFVAIAGHIMDPTISVSLAAAAWYPMSAFAIGILAAGTIPVALHHRHPQTAWGLSTFAAAMFVLGLGFTLNAVAIKGNVSLEEDLQRVDKVLSRR